MPVITVDGETYFVDQRTADDWQRSMICYGNAALRLDRASRTAKLVPSSEVKIEDHAE